MSDYEEMNKARAKWLKELGVRHPSALAAFARGYLDALKDVANAEICTKSPAPEGEAIKALRTVRAFLAGEQIAHALVAVDGPIDLKNPVTLGQYIDRVLDISGPQNGRS